MKRLIWLPIAGFLLIAGATVAAAAPGLVSTATSLVAAEDDTSTTSGMVVHADGAGSLLDEVLTDLVTQGVITQEQSDAITSALTTKTDERRAEMEAQRQQLEAMRTQIQGFLEDGVITADEIAQLPADNPFTKLEGILDDGQITQEELQSFGPFGGFLFDGPGRGHGHGPGFGRGPGGPGMWGPDANDPNANPGQAPSATPEATTQGS